MMLNMIYEVSADSDIHTNNIVIYFGLHFTQLIHAPILISVKSLAGLRQSNPIIIRQLQMLDKLSI